jgi:hypothetical protein
VAIIKDDRIHPKEKSLRFNPQQLTPKEKDQALVDLNKQYFINI